MRLLGLVTGRVHSVVSRRRSQFCLLLATAGGGHGAVGEWSPDVPLMTQIFVRRGPVASREGAVMLDASCLEHRSYPASCDPPHTLWTGQRLGPVVESEGTRAVFRRAGLGLPRERVEVLAQGTCRSAGPRCRAGSPCGTGVPLWLWLSRALAFSLRLQTCSRRGMQTGVGFVALPTGGRLLPSVAVSVFALLLPVA